jgi:polyribonucleotide nucleotidyltransferase
MATLIHNCLSFDLAHIMCISISSPYFVAVQIEVDPDFHPKIIGKRGAVITKIRQDHDVQINFPKKGDPEEHVITITGYEKNTLAAKEDIMKIVNELVSCTRENSIYVKFLREFWLGRIIW